MAPSALLEYAAGSFMKFKYPIYNIYNARIPYRPPVIAPFRKRPQYQTGLDKNLQALEPKLVEIVLAYPALGQHDRFHGIFAIGICARIFNNFLVNLAAAYHYLNIVSKSRLFDLIHRLFH